MKKPRLVILVEMAAWLNAVCQCTDSEQLLGKWYRINRRPRGVGIQVRAICHLILECAAPS